MNSSSQSIAFDTREVNDILDNIDKNLKIIKEIGYDTTDLYKSFDLLRHEILSNKNITRLSKEGQIDDFIRKLHIFDDLISTLTSEFIENSNALNSRIFDVKITNNSITSKNEKVRYIKENSIYGRNIIASILTVLTLISGPTASIGFGIGFYRNQNKSPQVTSYSINSEGTISKNTRFDKQFSEDITIYDFSKKDGAGYRYRKEYHLQGIQIDENTDIDKIDLSEIPFTSTLVNADESVKTDGEYREVLFEVQNKDIIGKTDSFDWASYCLLVFLVTLLCIVIEIVLLMLLDLQDLFDTEALEAVRDLIKIKAELHKLKKRIKRSEEEIENSEKVVNTLINRIDKTIKKASEELTTARIAKEISKEREVKKADKKFKEIKDNKDKERKAKQQKLSELMSLIKEDILYKDEEGLEEIYHSIEITEDLLFEKVDDHFKIRSIYLPFLKLFDLSNISFNNVDIRYVDFRGTNAQIDPTKVYNKDMSYAKFDDNNIYDWKDYTQVTLLGTEMDEEKGTMIGIERAITDEKTVLKRK